MSSDTDRSLPKKKPPPVPARKPQLYINTAAATAAAVKSNRISEIPTTPTGLTSLSVPRKPPRSKHDNQSPSSSSNDCNELHFPSREATHRVLIGTLMLHNGQNNLKSQNQRSGQNQRPGSGQIQMVTKSSLPISARQDPSPQINGTYSNGITSEKRRTMEVLLNKIIISAKWLEK